MIGNHPPRRPVYGRDHAAVRAPDERERRAGVRRAAEALFAPTPSTTEQPVDLPASVPVEPVDAAAHRQPPPREIIPATDVGRTWVKYGMTIPQIAAIYGVEADEITRILRRPSRGWTGPA